MYIKKVIIIISNVLGNKNTIGMVWILNRGFDVYHMHKIVKLSLSFYCNKVKFECIIHFGYLEFLCIITSNPKI